MFSKGSVIDFIIPSFLSDATNSSHDLGAGSFAREDDPGFIQQVVIKRDAPFFLFPDSPLFPLRPDGPDLVEGLERRRFNDGGGEAIVSGLWSSLHGGFQLTEYGPSDGGQ